MPRIYAVKLDFELREDTYQLLIQKVSAGKRARIEKFARREDKIRCLYAGLLTEYALVRYWNFKKGSISFLTSSFGKPYVEGTNNVHFNVSHSGEWVVCVVDEQPVGIDVERIVPVDLQIAQAYFSNTEKENLFALERSEQLHFFYQLWTLKESFLKLVGKGLSIPLDTFTIAIDPENSITISECVENTAAVYFKQFDFDPGYAIAACAMSDSFENVVSLSVQEINLFFLL